MISAALSAFVAWLFFSRWPPTQDYALDLPVTVTVVPLLMAWLLGFTIAALTLPPALGALVFVFYILVPLLVLRLMHELSWKQAAIGTTVVVAILIGAEIAVAYLLFGGFE